MIRFISLAVTIGEILTTGLICLGISTVEIIKSTSNKSSLFNFSSNVYFDHFDSKEAAIRFLVDQQQFENEDSKQRFLHSIFEREEIQSTYLEKTDSSFF